MIATTRAAIALGRVICERDPAAAQARDERLLAEGGGNVPTTIRQSMLPCLWAGLIASGSAGAGSLFAQPRVTPEPGDDYPLQDELSGSTVRVQALDHTLGDHDAAWVQVWPSCGPITKSTRRRPMWTTHRRIWPR